MKVEKKEKKRKNTVSIIVVTILLCVISGIVTYYGTLAIDKARKGGEVAITVTFDDSETYRIPSISKMTKEEVGKEWPYIFKVENSGNAKGLYQLIIKDVSESNIKREDLDYALYLDEKMVKEGHLNDIKNDILYEYFIDKETIQEYKLYIWANKEQKEDSVYEYKLDFTVIKEGGPGF